MNKSHLFRFINNPDIYLFGYKQRTIPYYSVFASNTRIINMFIFINKTGIFLLRYKQHFLSYYSAFLNATKNVSFEKIINMFRINMFRKRFTYSWEALKYSV